MIALSLIASSVHRNSPLLWGREVNGEMLLRRWSLFWLLPNLYYVTDTMVFHRRQIHHLVSKTLGENKDTDCHSRPLFHLSVFYSLSASQTAPALWAERTSNECLCSDCWEMVNRTWLWQWRRLWLAWASSGWCLMGCMLKKRFVAMKSSSWPSCRKWNWKTAWSKSSVNRPSFC